MTRRLFLAAVLAVSMLWWYATPGNAQDQFGSNWTGQYFDNTGFSGSPVFTRIDQQINFNFGLGSPDDRIPDDNFSVRWTTTENFAESDYEFLAELDINGDVRMFVDGVLVIDTFSGNDVIISQFGSGNLPVTVEYVHRTGESAISIRWRIADFSQVVSEATSTPGPTPLPEIPPGALTATVIRANVLLVREAPFLGAPVVGRIRRGETYQVIGRNDDATWFLLDIGGVQGWSWNYYLFIDGNEFNPNIENPFITAPIPASQTDTVVVSEAILRLREGPSINTRQIGRVEWGALLPVVGRSGNGVWYQVVWEDTVGWILADFTRVVEGDLDGIPVTSTDVIPPPAEPLEPYVDPNIPTEVPLPTIVGPGSFPQEFTITVTTAPPATVAPQVPQVQVDPATGFEIDPVTGLPINPETGNPIAVQGE